MLKVKLVLPLFGLRTINIPKFSKNTPLIQKLFKLNVITSQVFFVIFLAFLPFSVLFLKEETYETAIFYVFSTLVIVQIGLFISSIFLGGRKRFIDPKGFAVVLVFALLTTTSAISTNPPTVANTFGIESIRGMAGVLVMMLVALFYLVSVNVTDFRFLKKSITAFVLGSVLLSYYFLLAGEVSFSSTIFILIGLILSTGLFIYSKRFKVLVALVPLSLFLFLFLNDIFSIKQSGFSISVIVLTVASLVATLVILLTVSIKYKNFFKKKVTLMFNTKKLDTSKILHRLSDALVLILPLVLLFLFIYLEVEKVKFEDFISNAYDDVKNAWNVVSLDTTDSAEQIRNIIFGIGGDYSFAGRSLLSSVLTVQGLVGVFAYLILWSYSIYLGLKNLINAFRDSNHYKLILPFTFSLILVPVLSLVIYPGIALIILFWLSLGFVSANVAILERGNKIFYAEKYWSVTNLKFRGKDLGKNAYLIRIFLSLTTLAITAVSVYLVLSTVGEV